VPPSAVGGPSHASARLAPFELDPRAVVTEDFAKARTPLVLLSAVAGFVDTAGYLALFGLFTAHVTGNLVTAGAAVARRAPEGVAARLAMIPIFMLSVAGTTLLARSLRRRGSEPLVPMFGAMTVMLALFWAIGVVLEPAVSSPDAWAVIVIGGSGVAALGVQNALMREALGSMSPTTVMTGNLTQLTMDLVQLAVPATIDPTATATAHAEALKRIVKFGLALAGFVAGAAAGAWLTGTFGLWSLGVPTLVTAFLTAMAFRSRVRGDVLR
jgi:uncharacterized membrane protein YoaK (UPF0700 family)